MTQLGLIPLPAEDQIVADAAEAYTKAKDMLDAAKESYEVTKTKLAAHFPEEPGEHIRVAGRYTVTVKRGEKLSWDSEALERMFASGQMPDYVKQTLTIHKKAYEALSPTQQQEVAAALTKGVAPATIKVAVTP